MAKTDENLLISEPFLSTWKFHLFVSLCTDFHCSIGASHGNRRVPSIYFYPLPINSHFATSLISCRWFVKNRERNNQMPDIDERVFPIIYIGTWRERLSQQRGVVCVTILHTIVCERPWISIFLNKEFHDVVSRTIPLGILRLVKNNCN
jgi:hypothetical protein